MGIITALTLEMALPQSHEARDAVAAGDARAFAMTARSNQLALRLVWDNLVLLRQRGLYESALLEALTATRTNHHDWPLNTLRWMITLADPERLRATGAPLPSSDPVRLYRGVAGVGRARRVRGLHWTTDVAQAQWFAERFPFADPGVYSADVPAAAIVAALDDRQEAECLVLLPPTLRVRRIWPLARS